MSYVITITIGLCIWIVLWALNVSGLDAILIAAVMVVCLSGLKSVVPRVSGRKDQ